MQKTSYSKLEIAGLIKTFELCFELAWKTLKDLLVIEGYETNTPRQTIKQAFQTGLIDNGQLWLEDLENKNIMSHIYDKEDSRLSLKLIKDHYYQMLKDLAKRLQMELEKCSA